MDTRAELYIPEVFRSFQGFKIRDIKEWRKKHEIELILDSEPKRRHFCHRCGFEQGAQKERTWMKVRHQRMMGCLSPRQMPKTSSKTERNYIFFNQDFNNLTGARGLQYSSGIQ